MSVEERVNASFKEAVAKRYDLAARLEDAAAIDAAAEVEGRTQDYLRTSDGMRYYASGQATLDLVRMLAREIDELRAELDSLR